MARKASSADPHYDMIPTVFSERVDMIPTVFCDGDFGNSGPQTHDICDPRNLQFTQESIKDSFSKAHNGVKLEEKGGRTASSADPHYHVIPTIFSQRVEMIPTVFCDRNFGNSGPQNHNICDPRSLQFTQESIKDSFSKAHNGVKLEDTVSDIKGGRTDFSPLGPLEVHEGDDGRLWCENNRRLWVARQAGVPAVEVKMKSNDFISRRLGEETREKLSDPEFFPKVRSSRA